MKSILSFIESHGYRAKLNADNSITFHIPFGFSFELETHTIRTMKEVKFIFGY